MWTPIAVTENTHDNTGMVLKRSVRLLYNIF